MIRKNFFKDLNNKKFLLTGAAGNLGEHYIDILVSLGIAITFW